MLRFLSLASVCFALSACMIYAPTYAPQTSTTVVHYESASAQTTLSELKQETNEATERVVLKPTFIKSTKSIEACEKLILPREAKPIFLTRLDMTNADPTVEVDVLLAKKVKELQTHIETMNSRFEQAHAKWLESCKQKLLD